MSRAAIATSVSPLTPRGKGTPQGKGSVRANLLAALVLLAPALSSVALDFSERAARIARFSALERISYGMTWFACSLIWGALLLSSARVKGPARHVSAGLFLCFFTLSLGAQAYFFEQYSAYLNADVSRFATDFTESVINQIWADGGNYLSFMGLAALYSAFLLGISRRILRSREVLRLPEKSALSRVPASVSSSVAPLLFLGSCFLPFEHRHKQPSTPDLLYLNAFGGLLQTQLGLSTESHQLRPRARASKHVRPIKLRTKETRNVVFVILESVRRDATCNAYDPACRKTEATNRLFEERYPLEQLRALDSSTAISMAVLWSGVGPHESRETLHTWPLLFDYARAAGYYTAYWTSQSMLFGNLRLWVENLNVNSLFTASDVDPESDIDLGASEDQFAEHALLKVKDLKEPYFLTIQLSNGHYPYLVQEDGPQPFQPASTSKAPEETESFKNYYQNAIYQQDQHLARVLKALRAAPGGDRTVIVYTSDHGEAFREHQQMGHTFSVLDEEILVPAWISAPEGVLTESERTNLASKRDAFSSHPDLTVTILDLLGVWDSPSLDPFREKILGVSLLRPEGNNRALPLTNCAAVWSCAFENWGYLKGARKLEARAWDFDYHCYDLSKDPLEQNNLGEAACADLKQAAAKTFGRLPGKAAKEQ